MGTGVVIVFVILALATAVAVMGAVAAPNMRRGTRRSPRRRSRSS